MCDDVIRSWLEKQDANTLHSPLRKIFARIPYTVTFVMDVRECGLLEVESYAKYKDNNSYILPVIDVYSKFLHISPVQTMLGLP